MGLPRGRRWEDRPLRANPIAAARVREALAVLHADTPPVPDAIALREQLHREACAATAARQAELRLRGE